MLRDTFPPRTLLSFEFCLMPGNSGLPYLSKDTLIEAKKPPHAQASGGEVCVGILCTYWLAPEQPIHWWHIVHPPDYCPPARHSSANVMSPFCFLSFENSDQLLTSCLHYPLVPRDYNADAHYAFFLSQFSFPLASLSRLMTVHCCDN